MECEEQTLALIQPLLQIGLADELKPILPGKTGNLGKLAKKYHQSLFAALTS
jgi:hypothetical protein